LKGKRCAARRPVPVRKEYKGRSYWQTKKG
jgi:hypothetical protein